MGRLDSQHLHYKQTEASVSEGVKEGVHRAVYYVRAALDQVDGHLPRVRFAGEAKCVLKIKHPQLCFLRTVFEFQ